MDPLVALHRALAKAHTDYAAAVAQSSESAHADPEFTPYRDDGGWTQKFRLLAVIARGKVRRENYARAGKYCGYVNWAPHLVKGWAVQHPDGDVVLTALGQERLEFARAHQYYSAAQVDLIVAKMELEQSKAAA